ncbi:MAG: HEAT repeat domain-containing protein [Planctomycetota bacterium]|nr:HEAT repeat domain-containing protein [Planctomycetota bacterium]
MKNDVHPVSVLTLPGVTLCLLAVFSFVRPLLTIAEETPIPPATWHWEKNIVPLALVMSGLWGETFQVDKALDRAGMRRGYELKNLSRFTVIVLANVPALRIPKVAMEELREFVSQGGGLVLLGGLSAYWNGGYSGTLLEEMLPASIKESYIDHFPTAEKGAKLTRANQADWPMAFDFQSGPTAYYYHKLIPKSDAKTQVKVGEQPALVSGPFGKGRVVACGLTVNGNPEADVLPFWDWLDWPVLLGQAIEWSGGVRPVGKPRAGNRKDGPAPLTQDELESLELELTELPENFVARAMATPDERAAMVLLDLAAPDEGDEAKCGLDVVLPSLLPYARPEWGEKLMTLARNFNPNIKTRNAALTLLGASRAPQSYAILSDAMKDKPTELAAMDGLGLLGNEKAVPSLKNLFEEALATAKVPDGPDRWRPIEYARASQPAAHAAIALYRLGDPDGVSRLCSFAANLNLHRRILWNASKRWPRDPVGQQILKSIIDHAYMQQDAWDFLGASAGPIPDSQGKAFVEYAASASDPVIIELLAGAIEKSIGKLPKAEWQTLTNANSGIIARMAKAVSGPSE